MLTIKLLTLFPDTCRSYLNTSIMKRAEASGAVCFEIIDIRTFATDKHHRVDGPPCGGGAGLIMLPSVMTSALRASKTPGSKVIYLSPKGQVFNQQIAQELSREKELVFFCGRYEGVDERGLKEVDCELSLGDFVLTGGELPALAVIDAITRLLPGVLNSDSPLEESFAAGLLEYPQYTLPREFEGVAVPEVLLGGNHQQIARWRLKESLRITLHKRPDLLANRPLTKEEKKLLEEIALEEAEQGQQD